ncbi:MAG: hypothetical protein ACOC41_07385, partial [Chitinivibrionales bacterium]
PERNGITNRGSFVFIFRNHKPAKVPEKVRQNQKLIKEIILRNEPNTKSVRVGHWTVHKKGHLQCIIILRHKSGEKFKFRLNLIGSGAHTVDVWSSALH